METFKLSRVGRIYREYDVTATLRDGSPATLASVDAAVLEGTPAADTVWTQVAVDEGVATVLLAGPDAAVEGAFTVPTGHAYLWLRVVDTPEILPVRVERILVI